MQDAGTGPELEHFLLQLWSSVAATLREGDQWSPRRAEKENGSRVHHFDVPILTCVLSPGSQTVLASKFKYFQSNKDNWGLLYDFNSRFPTGVLRTTNPFRGFFLFLIDAVLLASFLPIIHKFVAFHTRSVPLFFFYVEMFKTVKYVCVYHNN